MIRTGILFYRDACSYRFVIYIFAVEVIHDACRAKDRDFPVWIKINSSDEEEGGFTVEEFLEDAVELSKLGIDAIEISGEQWSAHKPSGRAYYKEPAEKLAALVQTPVILTGGLRTLDDISDIYEHSNIEFFGFARPFMMNTDFVKELEAQVK